MLRDDKARQNIAFYRGLNARALCDLYESTTFENVHQSWLKHLPKNPGLALDVGTGSGRDSAALVRRGWQVVAVDCSPDMLREAKRWHLEPGIRWVHGCLPDLGAISGERFALILCSAVWMHLSPTERVTAMSTIRGLLEQDGIGIITLRHPPDLARGMFDVTITETTELGQQNGLAVLQATHSRDPVPEWERPEISWSTVVLQRTT